MPAGLSGIDSGQRLPHCKEALGILISKRGPPVQSLAQEGPAAGVEALRERLPSFRPQRADVRDHGPRVESQGRDNVVHGVLQGEWAAWAQESSQQGGRSLFLGLGLSSGSCRPAPSSSLPFPLSEAAALVPIPFLAGHPKDQLTGFHPPSYQPRGPF